MNEFPELIVQQL